MPRRPTVEREPAEIGMTVGIAVATTVASIADETLRGEVLQP
jgi:hypothetical protein